MTVDSSLTTEQPPLPAELSADQLIGERVHSRMFRARVTQTSLARQLGMQQSGLSRRLRGESAWLASEVMHVARILGVSYVDLMPGPGEATIPPSPSGGPSTTTGELRSSR